MKHSKKYQAAKEKITAEAYSIEAAVALLKEISFEKFDSTVQLAFNLNVDPRHADQQLRGSLVLPNGSGKTAKVLAVVKPENLDKAKEATYSGGLELLEKIKTENWFDFDFIVTTPDLMAEFAKYGKILGPKGLMPNPKLGTVTNDVQAAISDILKGQIEYRTDKEGNISVVLGKKSFQDSAIVENYKAIFNTIVSKRPASVKGEYIKSISVSTAMSPSIKIENIK